MNRAFTQNHAGYPLKTEILLMRRNVITTLALLAAFAIASVGEAEAGRRRVRNNRRPRITQRSSGNMFSGIMDLERRKNAWLRATFLGR